MWNDTGITRRLQLALPIVQGPFGGGLSSVDLVAAVSGAGALGSFGAHHLEPDAILRVAADIRRRTPRPFALNLWIPFHDADAQAFTAAAYARFAAALAPHFDALGVPLPARPERYLPRFEDQLEVVLEARPAVFSFVFGHPPPDVLERCRAAGILTLGTATTVEEARVLEDAGVDAVVATGFEAGGHRVSFLRPAEESLTGTLALVPQVVDAVRVPVIAAGGIADGRGVAAALALGAQAAQLGTAFLACRESAASGPHRDALFSPAARRTALTRAFSGRLARGIENRFMTEFRAAGRQPAPYPIQNWLMAQLKPAAVTQGRTDLIALWCGQSAALLRHRDAGGLIAQLARDAAACVAGL